MASIAKFKAPAVGNLLRHDTRQEEDGYFHSNELIDSERTHFNYDLCPNEGKAFERFKARMGEVYCMDRDDINVLDSLCVHLPNDVKNEDREKFFEVIYKFACEEYGEDNIMTAAVHKDETRDHIHVDFIPVVKDEKRGEKVCHNELITRTYLNTLHPRLSAYVEEHLGYEVEIMNGATVNGNKTIEQLKLKALQKERASKQEQVNELTESEKTLKESVKNLQVENSKAVDSLIHGLPPAPEPPKVERWADWEIWKNHYHPTGKKGKPLKENTRRWRKAMDEEYKRHTEHNAPWVEYDRLYTEWIEEVERLGAVEKAVQQYQSAADELAERLEKVEKREERVSYREQEVERKENQLDKEIEKRAGELVSDYRHRAGQLAHQLRQTENQLEKVTEERDLLDAELHLQKVTKFRGR